VRTHTTQTEQVGVFPCRGWVAPCQRAPDSIKGLPLRCQTAEMPGRRRPDGCDRGTPAHIAPEQIVGGRLPRRPTCLPMPGVQALTIRGPDLGNRGLVDLVLAMTYDLPDAPAPRSPRSRRRESGAEADAACLAILHGATTVSVTDGRVYRNVENAHLGKALPRGHVVVIRMGGVFQPWVR
jgi:hypothetical protein